MGRYVGTPEHAIGMKSCGAPAQLKKILKFWITVAPVVVVGKAQVARLLLQLTAG
jgi:hypothetical protein